MIIVIGCVQPPQNKYFVHRGKAVGDVHGAVLELMVVIHGDSELEKMPTKTWTQSGHSEILRGRVYSL